MYETINDVPEVVKDFYFEETVNELSGEMLEETYEVEGYDKETFEPTGETETRTRQVPEYLEVTYVRQITQPELKELSDLERLINLNKPQAVLDMFADMVAEGYQWRWFDTYVEYQAKLAKYVEAQEAFEPVTDEEGFVTQFTEVEPIEPIRPIIQTGADVLEPYLRQLFKKSRTKLVNKITVEVNGMVFDGDESAQDRMARAVLVLDEDETTLWVLANNEPVRVSKFQLLTALKLAGQAQTDLWT